LLKEISIDYVVQTTLAQVSVLFDCCPVLTETILVLTFVFFCCSPAPDGKFSPLVANFVPKVKTC
jgi:hypothetical protein